MLAATARLLPDLILRSQDGVADWTPPRMLLTPENSGGRNGDTENQTAR